MSDAVDLAELGRLREAATKPPWRQAFPGGPKFVYDTLEAKMVAQVVELTDAAYIVALVNAAPALLQAAADAGKLREALRELVDSWDGGNDPDPNNWTALDRRINAALSAARALSESQP